jgi:radical SAM protein with 4Fe4S-binding SPASM domain
MIRYTELKSTNRQDLLKLLPLAKPFTVLIEPTSLCNFRCIQCFQSIGTASYFTRNRTHMPFTRLERVIAQMTAWPGGPHKVLKLSLYGEPLLCPDFPAMLRLAGEARVAERMETTTNASLLTREIAEALVESQIDYVRVSVYSADQQRHRAVTRSRISIDAMHANLRVLQEVKRANGAEKPFVSCKMLDSYGGENEHFLAMYRDVADEVYIDKPHGWIKVDGADFIGTYYEDGAPRAILDLEENSTARVVCPMAFTTMAVRSNGAVSPCCVDFIGGTNLDNVDDHSLQEIWNSDAWYEFQKMQLEDRKDENYSCARCDIYKSDYYTRDNIDGFPVDRLRQPGNSRLRP